MARRVGPKKVRRYSLEFKLKAHDVDFREAASSFSGRCAMVRTDEVGYPQRRMWV